MDTKTLLLLHTMCIIGSYVYADKRVDVVDNTCGQTYNIDAYKSISLMYDPDHELLTDPYLKCTLTFVSNDRNTEICIKTPTSYWDTSSCNLNLKYFLGKIPSYSRWDGHSCSEFRTSPLCTKERKVFAVYKSDVIILLSSFEVIIYTKKLIATTTRRTTTTDWNSDNYEESHSGISNTTGSIAMVFIGVVIVCVLVCLCCKRAIASSTNVPVSQAPIEYTQASASRLQDLTPESRDQTSRSRDQTTRSQTFTDDAPAYSSLIHQQQHEATLVDDNDNNWQFNDEERDDESVASSDSLNRISVDTDDSIPTVPPPAYDDLDPPPPYPGY